MQQSIGGSVDQLDGWIDIRWVDRLDEAYRQEMQQLMVDANAAMDGRWQQ